MRAHPALRVVVALAGGAVALGADGPQSVVCALVIAVGFLASGEPARTSFRLIAILAPAMAISALLWSLVLARPGEVFAPPSLLFADGSRLLSLWRALVGSSAVILGFATAPDGELYLFLRRLRMPRGAAAAFTAGATMAAGVADTVSQTQAALRVQGMVGSSFFSRLGRLGDVLSVAWVSSLSAAAARAECKWVGNDFLVGLDPPPLRDPAGPARGTWVLGMTTLLLTTTLLARTYVDRLL